MLERFKKAEAFLEDESIPLDERMKYIGEEEDIHKPKKRVEEVYIGMSQFERKEEIKFETFIKEEDIDDEYTHRPDEDEDEDEESDDYGSDDESGDDSDEDLSSDEDTDSEDSNEDSELDSDEDNIDSESDSEESELGEETGSDSEDDVSNDDSDITFEDGE